MDDILSQIIAYAPNKIDTETKARSLVQGPRNMADGGQIIGKAGGVVEPGVIYYGVNKRIDKDGKPHVKGKPWELSKSIPEDKHYKEYYKTKAEAQAEYDKLLKKYPDKRFRTKEEQKIFEKIPKVKLLETGIYKTRSGKYEAKWKSKTIGTFNKISEARDARKTAMIDNPADPTYLYDGKISFNAVVENTMDELLEEGYESFSQADINKKLSKKIKEDYGVTNEKLRSAIYKNRQLDKFKDFKFVKGTGLNQVKPLTKAKQLMLETSFPEIEFDFTTGRKYGIDKASDPIRWTKIKQFISMPSEGSFPYGYQAKDGLWNSLYRSTVSGNRWELISKVPKNWKKDGAWKKAKFKDTQTGDIITYDNLKEYVDSQGGKGAYENSLKSWDNKRELSKIKIMYQGKEQSLGGVLNKVALAKSKKKPPTGMKNLPGFATFHIAHKKGVGNNFWDVEVAYRDANLKLQQLNKSMLADLKNVDDSIQKNKIIKNYAKQIKELPGGASFMFEGQELGKAPTLKGATEAAFKDLGLSKTYKANQKRIQKVLQDFEAHPGGCGRAAGGRILFSEGSPDGKITKCAQRGIQAFIDDLKKGNYSKATMNILKGGGNVLKNILDPKELLKMRNYFGPVALGFMAAFEGGVITDDVVRQGTPLNESLANNWLTKSFLPYTKDYAQAKNLLESGTVPSNMKKYVEDVVTFNEALKDIQGIEGNIESRLVDIGGYGMIDDSSMYSQEQQEKDEADVMKKLSSITDYNFMSGSAKDLEYKKMLDEMEATRMAKPKSIMGIQYSDGFSPIFGFGNLEDRNQKTDFDSYISPVDTQKDLRPVTYMDAKYEDVKTLPASVRKRYEDYFSSEEGGNLLKPRQSLSELKYEDSNIYEEILKDYNKFQRQKEASQFPGYYGTQEPDRYMEGGIASLNVNKK